MKIVFAFTLAVIMFAVNFYGCKKNESTQIQPSSTSLQFKFKFNGSLLIAAICDLIVRITMKKSMSH